MATGRLPKLSRRWLLLYPAGAVSVLAQSGDAGWLALFGARTVTVDVSGRRGFVLLPARPRADGSKPWVWYAPAITGRYPAKSNVWLLTRLLQQGFAVCGVDAGESYGSPDGTRVFQEFYRTVVERYGLSPRACLLPQSRGGLMLYAWAAEHPEAVECVGGIYPVCDLRSYPRLSRASAAYRMTEDELRSEIGKHNPIDRLAPLAARGIPILHVHGDADKVVPLEQNSLVMALRYRALGGTFALVVTPGKGHEEVPEFFESQALLDFFLSLGRNIPCQ